ncbi:hypothetical protein H9Y04_43685 [Streptomyces sp. TRM66268-LWL]|uniref:Efflux RND transporter periplasmic adaptor subunit n=1 Tax=Streptomyces polyasparticus TaxID=2767826 RepID=A0ABR7SWV9_9ACTN|nr:hypothetical protein [Streptomyces polyasparticus]MBC9719432.1 hypothetical protein [Streptomyces polyasparticus]
MRTVTPATDGGAQSGGRQAEGQDQARTKTEVQIAIEDQKALAGLDTATVDVELVSDRAKNALSVPVTALVAMPDGGYGVEVMDRGRPVRRIPVTLGLFAQGRVQVSGKGLTEGMNVRVPR